jgi:hypothetical protein
VALGHNLHVLLSRREVLGAGAATAGLLACRPKADVGALADMLLGSSRDAILQRVAKAMERGATAEHILTASFVALLDKGADWEDVHGLLVVPSILFHVRSAGLLPVFWCAANAVEWPGHPYALAPRPVAGDELARAFAEGDLAMADAAVLSLGLAAEPRLAMEATRGRPDPHGAIYAAQGARMASFLDERRRLLWLRSLARHLARTGPAAPEPPPLRLEPANTTSSVEIARALRDGRAVSLDGLSPGALWEGLALLALGTRYQDPSPSGIGVHQTTLLDALWFLYDNSPPAQQATVLARAVPFVLGVQNPVQAPLPLRLPPEGEARPDVEALRREVALKGSSEHDFKYFGAVEAIAPKLSVAFQPKWWTGAARAHPIGSAYRWERAPEAEALIARL